MLPSDDGAQGASTLRHSQNGSDWSGPVRPPRLSSTCAARPIPSAFRRSRQSLVLTLALSFGVLAHPAEAARVAVLMSNKVPEYEEALKGFKQSGPFQVVAEYDMDGDLKQGQKYLDEIEAKVKPDLIFAVGRWALQATINRPVSIPVVYAMVLNPPSIL